MNFRRLVALAPFLNIALGGCGPAATSYQPVDRCDFSLTYSFGYVGSWGPPSRTTLSPGNLYLFEMTDPQTHQLKTCSPIMPACNSPGTEGDVIRAGDIEALLGHPDIQRAFAARQPPLYGFDHRPTDGAVFELVRGDGRGFLVGDPCRRQQRCVEIPFAITDLVNWLRELNQQQLDDPSCAHLKIT